MLRLIGHEVPAEMRRYRNCGGTHLWKLHPSRRRCVGASSGLHGARVGKEHYCTDVY